MNDQIMIVVGSPETGKVRKEVFSFHDLPPGSPIRANRVAEYERYIEALKGQGCHLATVSIEDWWRFARRYPDHFKKRWAL